MLRIVITLNFETNKIHTVSSLLVNQLLILITIIDYCVWLLRDAHLRISIIDRSESRGQYWYSIVDINVIFNSTIIIVNKC